MQIGVMIETITSNVMCIMVSLPPRNGYTGKAVAGKNLNNTVQSRVWNDLVVTGIMTEPSRLNPTATHYKSSQEMQKERFLLNKDDKRNRSEKENEGGENGNRKDKAFLLKESFRGESSDEIPIRKGGRGNFAIGDTANEVRGEVGMDR